MKLRSAFDTLAFVILTITSTSSIEVVSNPFPVRRLYVAENHLVKELTKCLANDSIQHDTRKKIILYLFDQSRVSDEIDGEWQEEMPDNDNDDKLLNKVVGNAVHVFRLLRRLISELPVIIESLTKDSICNIAQPLEEMKEKIDWPDEMDLSTTGVNLARIQNFYFLPILDLAKGKISFISSKARLDVDDLFFIGHDRLLKPNMVRNTGAPEFALAIEWMEAALELSKQLYPKGGNSAREYEIEQKILETRKLHDDNFQPPIPGDMPTLHPSESFFHQKIGLDLNVRASYLREREESEFWPKKTGKAVFLADRQEYIYRDYVNLCRGSKTVNGADNRAEKCQLSTNGNPYFYLGPLKIEHLVIEPPVFVIHDLFSDRQMDLVKKNARGNMQTKESVARVGLGEVSFIRTQSSHYLADFVDGSEYLQIMNQMLEDATGLFVHRRIHPNITKGFVESEVLQIGVYGAGGLYLPHTDLYHHSDEKIKTGTGLVTGNRIATAMIYLDDQVLGGATAFVRWGVFAFPKKGSVAFWYNQLRDLRMDTTSLHSGCPVLHGIKWVANKWIRSSSQMFIRPCGVSPNSGVMNNWQKIDTSTKENSTKTTS